MAGLASRHPRRLCGLAALGGDPQDDNEQSVSSRAARRGQAWRCPPGWADPMPTLRSKDDGLLYRLQSRRSTLRMQAWLPRQRRAALAFGGRSADEAIEGELLRVLEPAAIEAALEAHREETRRCDATSKPRAMPPTRRSDNTTLPTPPIVWWQENWSYAGIALSSASPNWRTELNGMSARPR